MGRGFGIIDSDIGVMGMSYEPCYKTEDMNLLLDALLKLRTREEAMRLLDDLCTVKEIQRMTQRIHVAKLLTNNVSYQIIKEKTGASTTTIGRVSKSLQYGGDGYAVVFDRMEEDPEYLRNWTMFRP